jgi:FG-GAP-like repeat
MTPNSQSNLPLGNGATPLFTDAFTGATAIENNWTVLKGSGATTKNPGLTAGTSTTFPTVPANGLPGFGGTPDTAGQGVLRLTDSAESQAAAVIYNQSIFSKTGVVIEFEYFQYGGKALDVGNGVTKKGDGISFFLLDGGAATPTQAGGFGGGLGYAQNNTVAGQGAGIVGGYLGIGLDAFGNFGQATEGRVGAGTGDTADSITVRGSAGTQYKYLTTSGAIAGGIDNESATATRSNSGRLVRIEVATDGKLTVKFDLNGNKTFEANETVINAFDTITAGNSALPDTVRFGFAASTGLATNNQEIRNLSISSIADVFTGGSGTVSYTAGATPIAVASALGINTVVLPTGATTFNGATVGITPTTYKTGQDFLTVGAVTGNTPALSGTFTNGLTWAFNANTGVLTVSGAGTPAQYQAALAQVSYYNNAGAAAITTDRTAQYILTGIAGTPSTTSIIKVAAGNTVAKRPEILFQDFATGEVGIWAVDTTGVLTGAKFVTLGSNFGTASGSRLKVAAGWKVIDTGDVDKDGIADILWYSSNTGEVALHYMTNEGQIKAAGFVTSGGNSIKVDQSQQWNPVGLADVTGDGVLDINWRAFGSDQIAYWQVAGTSTALTGSGILQNTAGTADFKAGDNSRGVKMGDFDGDGKIDMLLSNGKVVTYGAFTAAATGTPAKLVAKGLVTLPSNGDASLVARAVGDYNGDGTTDIVFESTTSDKEVLQYINSTTAAKSLPLTGTPTLWNIGASKDFSGDTTPDLVWHNTVSGETAIWAIDKLTGNLITTGGVTAFVTLKPATGPNVILKTASTWDVVGADDFGSVTFA